MGNEPRLLAVAFAVAALVTGLVSQALTFFPLGWGDLNWEVAVFSRSSATMALPTIGATILAVEAMVNRRRGRVRVLGGVLLVIGIVALVGLLVVGTAVPVVWNAARVAPEPQALGYKIVTIKALALCGLYGVMLIGLAGYMIRSTFKS